MPAAYTPPNLSSEKARALEQGLFDFLVPFKAQLLTPQQVAKSLGRSVDFVYQMGEEGLLEVFTPEQREKARQQITKRSVFLLLAAQANFSPEDIVPRLVEIVATLTKAQYAAFLQAAADRRSRV